MGPLGGPRPMGGPPPMGGLPLAGDSQRMGGSDGNAFAFGFDSFGGEL